MIKKIREWFLMRRIRKSIAHLPLENQADIIVKSYYAIIIEDEIDNIIKETIKELRGMTNERQN